MKSKYISPAILAFSVYSFRLTVVVIVLSLIAISAFRKCFRIVIVFALAISAYFLHYTTNKDRGVITYLGGIT